MNPSKPQSAFPQSLTLPKNKTHMSTNIFGQKRGQPNQIQETFNYKYDSNNKNKIIQEIHIAICIASAIKLPQNHKPTCHHQS